MNPKERSDRISIRVYACYHCEGIIGNTTDNVLFVGSARFIKSVTMRCGYCDKLTYWRPTVENNDDKTKYPSQKLDKTVDTSIEC